MTAITEFYDYVLPQLPGAGKFLAFQAIREAAIDFCERTLVYNYNIPAIDVVGGQSVYVIAPLADTQIADIIAVRYNQEPLVGANEADLDVLVPEWRTTATGVPTYYRSTIERELIQLVVTPADSLAEGLNVRVALAPLPSSNNVPDWMFERYRNAIANGALARVFSMKKRPWTDNELAVFHAHMFEQEIGRANTLKAKGYTRQPLRSTPCFR